LDVRVLLDTHLLLWALGSPSKLAKKARQRIDSSEVFASAASIREISTKCALGKLEANPAEVLAGIEPVGFSHLSITFVDVSFAPGRRGYVVAPYTPQELANGSKALQ
jgi:PIN domain nuclease of toxin-antitoxin system